MRRANASGWSPASCATQEMQARQSSLQTRRPCSMALRTCRGVGASDAWSVEANRTSARSAVLGIVVVAIEGLLRRNLSALSTRLAGRRAQQEEHKSAIPCGTPDKPPGKLHRTFAEKVQNLAGSSCVPRPTAHGW